MPNEQHIRLFLEHVLPPYESGFFIGVATHHRDKDPTKSFWAGSAVESMSEAVAAARFQMGLGNEVFCVLALQGQAREKREASEGRKAGRWKRIIRGAENSVSMRCLWADIDLRSVKHPDLPYTTREEAVAGLYAFCDSISLPRPTLLCDSGGGNLHVYWRLDTTLPRAQWHPLARKLANAMRHCGFKAEKVDDANTALRIPSGLNYKYDPPREVKMSLPGAELPLALVEAALAPFGLREVPNNPETEINDEFSSGIGQAAPVDLYAVAEAECWVFDDAIGNEGAGHDEPLWSLLLYAATFSDDPEHMAHEMSRGHATYDEEETQAKFNAKLESRKNPRLGWPTCEQFNAVSPLCRKCKWWGKITSPFKLSKPETVADPSPAASDDLPDGYTRANVTGFIMGAKGTKEKPFIGVILKYALRNGALTEDGGRQVLTFEARIMDVWEAISFPTLPTTDRVIAELHDRRMYVDVDDRKHVEKFIMSWMLRLQHRKALTTSYGIGWNGDAFSFNEMLHDGKASRTVTYNAAPEGYGVQGTLEPWKRAAKFVCDQKRPELQVLLATAFASPLIKLRLEQGVLVSVFGSQSGRGKSLTTQVAQAVWGDPIIGINGVNDTTNAVQDKATRLRHLPMYWDDIQTKDQWQKVEEMIFNLGTSKSKLKLKRNSGPMGLKTYALMLTAISNTSILQKMINNKSGTEAGPNRVFEVMVPYIPPPSDPNAGVIAQREVRSNYGRAGEVYAEYLGRNKQAVQDRIDQFSLALQKHLQVNGEERFWSAAFVSIMVGAELAVKLNLVPFDLTAMYRFLASTFNHLRNTVSTNVTVTRTEAHAEEFLSIMIEHGSTQFMLYTDKIWDHVGKPGSGEVNLINKDTRLTKGPWAQLSQDDRLRFTRSGFREYVAAQGQNFEEVVTMLKTHCGMVEKEKCRIGAGVAGQYSAVGKGRQRGFELVLPLSLRGGPSGPSASPGYPGS